MKVGAVSETVDGDRRDAARADHDVRRRPGDHAKMVENIPLNGRKFQDLSLLVPGTRPSNYYDPTKTEVGGISYGGATGPLRHHQRGRRRQQRRRRARPAAAVQRRRDPGVQGHDPALQRRVRPLDGRRRQRHHQERHRTTSTAARSCFARNESLNAQTFFEEADGRREAADFSQQQFGGTLGGPISKDRAHFFVSYERNRRNGLATSLHERRAARRGGPDREAVPQPPADGQAGLPAERRTTR